MTDAIATEVSALSFEQAVAELDSIIQRLEAGQIDLEEAVNVYSRGTELSRHCSTLLDRTEATITHLVASVGAGQNDESSDANSSPGGKPQPQRARRVEPRSDTDVVAQDIPF